ncbi:MAG: sigma-70 family RNA polymerase sigma factor [Alphaproteobacteria bacterium]
MGTTNDDLGAAFTGLRHSLRGFLARRVNDPAVVDDLLQDVFLKAQKAMGDGRLPNNLPAWLSTAARTKVIDHYRAKRPAAEILDENTPDHGLDGGEDMHRELATCLRPLAQTLPPIYRDTLLATDLGGQSMQAVADELGLSLSAIKSRASRGRGMLRDIVLNCCEVEATGGMVTDFQRRTAKNCGCG